CFNTSRPGGDCFFSHDPEWTDLTCRSDVRPSAKFHRVSIKGMRCAADLQYTDSVAVFFAEELNDVFPLSYLSLRNLCPRHGPTFRNLFVHQFLYVADLLLRQCRAR